MFLLLMANGKWQIFLNLSQNFFSVSKRFFSDGHKTMDGLPNFEFQSEVFGQEFAKPAHSVSWEHLKLWVSIQSGMFSNWTK